MPSFYKRRDAWILGAVVARIGPVRAAPATKDDDEDEDEENSDERSPAAALAERTIARARRFLKATSDAAFPIVKLAPASEVDARKALATAQRSGRALTGFEPSSRDVERRLRALHPGRLRDAGVGRDASVLWKLVLRAAHRASNRAREARGDVGSPRAGGPFEGRRAVSTFTLAAADDVIHTAVLLGAGFRRSGVLARHVMLKGERKDAIVWSKKLAGAGDQA